MESVLTAELLTPPARGLLSFLRCEGLVIAGGAVLVVSVFRDYVRVEGFGQNVSEWRTYAHDDVLLIVLGALAMALSLLSLFVLRKTLLALIFAIGFIALGLTIFIPFESAFNWGQFREGFYMGPAGSLAISLGALLGWWATEAPALAPVGWYPDPSGEARLRLWSGEHWTSETRD